MAVTLSAKNVHKLEPLDEERREFLGTRTKKAIRENPYLKELRDHMLEIGGEAVVLWNGSNSERFVRDLIALGNIRPGVGLRMQRGDPGNCHENSRRLASKRPQQYLRCTGYALSADNVWRPHSWIWDVKGDCIVETTEKRLVYFGMIEVTG